MKGADLKSSGSASCTDEMSNRREGLVRFGRLGRPAFGSSYDCQRIRQTSDGHAHLRSLVCWGSY